MGMYVKEKIDENIEIDLEGIPKGGVMLSIDEKGTLKEKAYRLLSLRCLEHVCYHNANVKIVIIGGGLAYGSLGVSHHSTEDIAIMRALPNKDASLM